jgi:hypothetical protein
MSELVDMKSVMEFVDGLWLGRIPSRYGEMELILDGTPDAPNEKKVAAIQAFLETAGETVERLRRRLPLASLWRPIRLAVNDQNRVGVLFQRRFLYGREMLFADE